MLYVGIFIVMFILGSMMGKDEENLSDNKTSLF